MTLTIFGSTGDLSMRKLFPALYNMEALHQLDEAFKIVAIGRKHYAHQQFLDKIRTHIQENARRLFDEAIFNRISMRILYYQMNLDEPQNYEQLNAFYKQHNIQKQTFYMALSPVFFHAVLDGLNQLDHIQACRILIEKPFGTTMKDMATLNQNLHHVFLDEHIYYIDHYLGKEMIQNIKTLRFHNALFQNSWNSDMIECIQISVLEKEGVANRGAYYDASGALKDMVQNHMFQLISILTMEENDNQHEAQLRILKKLRIQKLLLGQYEGYLNECDVHPASTTETYAEIACIIDDENWKHVPIYLRTGKKLNKKEIVVIIKFKALKQSTANLLEICIQPNEGIFLHFNIKKAGHKNLLETVRMKFCPSCTQAYRMNTPEAYEYLLDEAFHDQKESFSTFDEIQACFLLMENISKPIPSIYQNKIEHSLCEWIEINHESR